MTGGETAGPKAIIAAETNPWIGLLRRSAPTAATHAQCGAWPSLESRTGLEVAILRQAWPRFGDAENLFQIRRRPRLRTLSVCCFVENVPFVENVLLRRPFAVPKRASAQSQESIEFGIVNVAVATLRSMVEPALGFPFVLREDR